MPAPHLAITDTQDLRRLPPTDLLGQSLQDHFLHFHGPLHGGLAVKLHAHLRHEPYHKPPKKRTFHLSIQPDISCVNDTQRPGPLTESPAKLTLKASWKCISPPSNWSVFTKSPPMPVSIPSIW